MNTMNVATKLRSAGEVELAVSASQKLSAVLQTNDEAQAINVLDKFGKTHEIIIPRSALVIMAEVLNQLGSGNYVSLTPIHAELTTQEGADLLNMSRPTFIKLLDSGEITCRCVGNRRKVSYEDLMSYKIREEDRLSALTALSAVDEENDIGY